MRRGLYVGLCLGLVTACGDDGTAVPADGSGTAGSSGETSAEGTTVAANDTGTSSGGEQDAESTAAVPDDPPLPFASGIRLERMTANQAVQVQLVEDGLEVDPSDYNTRMIPGRITLIRAYWSLHADFTPRTLIGRLVIDYPDGEQMVQDFPLMIDGPSTDGSASFQWILQPEQVVPGMRYRAKVLEPNPDLATGEISDPPPILPLTGRGTLGLYEAPLELKIELIPLLHQFEGEECMPNILEADIEAMRQELEQNNPVQQAIFTVGDPMPYTDPIGTSGMGFSPVLSALAQRRAADDPAPNVYYYGLLDPCDGYPPGLLGQAIGIPDAPTMELSQERIATGRWWGSGELAAETFVHEIGHTQGRYHVLCSGGEAGADIAYPHPQGRIGVWGFGIYDFKLRSPSISRDYMTYCSNEWVSDYSWEQTLDVIEILTSWDQADAPAPPDGPGLLMGALYPDGTEEWWTAPGALPPELATPGASLEVTREYGVRTLPARVYTRPHSDTIQVITTRPEGLGDAERLDLHTPDRVAPSSVDPTVVRDIYVP